MKSATVATPSLMRRVLLTVVAAVLLVFTILYIFIGYSGLKRESGELDRTLLRTARGMAQALETAGSEEAARAGVALFRNIVTDQVLSEPDREPPVHLLVARRDGAVRLAQPGAPAIDVLPLADGIGVQVVDGRTWRLYVGSGPTWKAVLADDDRARGRFVLWNLLVELLVYLAFALPVIVLPVWLSVRTALSPLRQLSVSVAARAPADMSPLVVRRSYRELQPLQDALNRLFERVAQGLAREKAFVHDAAHELRTPLAVISTQAHVLAHSEPSARTEARERLEAAVARASHLASQLLRLAQAESLALALRHEVDVMDSVRDTLAAFSERAAAQGSELSLGGPDSLLATTDPQALRSILENLVDNALRYGEARCTVEVSVQRSGSQWLLRVADDGPGIAPAQRERVFERFWRGRAEQARGAGLGLAIVREAARALGGSVHVEDGLQGRGCAVVVTLP